MKTSKSSQRLFIGSLLSLFSSKQLVFLLSLLSFNSAQDTKNPRHEFHRQEVIKDNQPISLLDPTTMLDSRINPWILPQNLYIESPSTGSRRSSSTPTNTWWMNLVLPGGTGFYYLKVVESGSQVTNPTLQISLAETQSLGIPASINQTVFVVRDVFQPSTNQIAFFVQSTPVGFRFINEETFFNSSSEFAPNRDWAFCMSAAEGFSINPQTPSSPIPGNSSSYPFRATSWSDLGVELQFETMSGKGTMKSPQVRMSAFQTFEFSGSISPLLSTVGGVLFGNITAVEGGPAVRRERLSYSTSTDCNDDHSPLPPHSPHSQQRKQQEKRECPSSGFFETFSSSQFQIGMSDGSVWLVFCSNDITLQQATVINYQIIPDDEYIYFPPTNFQYIQLQTALQLDPPLTVPQGPTIGNEYQYLPTFSPQNFNGLRSTTTWEGIIRITRVPNGRLVDLPSVISLLQETVAAVPVSGSAVFSRAETDGSEVGWRFTYRTKDMFGGVSPTVSPLFMLTPLLVSQLSINQRQRNSTALVSSRGQLQYIQAAAVAAAAVEDNGKERLFGFQFEIAEVPLPQFFNDSVHIVAGKHSISVDDTATLVQQLQWDQRWTNLTTFTDTYTGGKELLALAEVSLFLSKLLSDNSSSCSVIYDAIQPGLSRLKNGYLQWLMDGSFFYDHSWGGLVGSSGLLRDTFDYSNILYQDHHFHYGYFVQTAAIIAHLDHLYLPTNITPWIQQPVRSNLSVADYIELFIRDVANPSSKDPYFPVLRVIDWEEGHSRAQGLFPTGSGGNEESTAEDINFWYGLMMWASITSSNPDLLVIGQVMSSRVAAAAQAYWQVGSSGTIYNGSKNIQPLEPATGVNQYPSIGILWDAKADPNTWFAATDYCAVGIQTIARLPSLLSLLVDDQWLLRMVNYFVDPTAASPDDWHIWSISPTNSNWYSILLPALSLQYASATRIVWNDPRCSFDNGNTRGSILFTILYWQSCGCNPFSGPFPPLNTANSSFPNPSTAFFVDCQQKFDDLVASDGPIAAFSQNLGALPPISQLIITIECNSEQMGLNPQSFPSPNAWQAQADAYLSSFQLFNAAYNQQVNSSIGLSSSQALASWQQFAAVWGLPEADSVESIQNECTTVLSQLNSFFSLSSSNADSLSQIIESKSLTSCVTLLDDLANELYRLSDPMKEPAALGEDLQFYSAQIIYDPIFLSHYPFISSNPSGLTCIQTFCAFGDIQVPSRFQSS